MPRIALVVPPSNPVHTGGGPPSVIAASGSEEPPSDRSVWKILLPPDTQTSYGLAPHIASPVATHEPGGCAAAPAGPPSPCAVRHTEKNVVPTELKHLPPSHMSPA